MTPAGCKEARQRLIEQLERERERQGLSARDIIERGGPSENTCRKWSLGRWAPTLMTFIAYAEALGWHVRLVKDGRLLGNGKP